MPSNPKRPGTAAGNTFTKTEIEHMVQLLDALHRGADVSILLRQQSVANVYAKFKRMRMRLVKINRELEQGDG